MDHETEVIKMQMEETRSSLTEKLETLEQQVAGTVQQATTAVNDTVDSVRDTVETVKDAVEDTMEAARESVKDTVDAIQETLNIPHQVERHPWGMLGGAVVIGFLGGYLLPSSRSQPTSNGRVRATEPSRVSTPPETASSSKLGDLLAREMGKLKGLAIGTTLGLVRELMVDHLPEPMRPDLLNVVNDLTEKLDGKVLPSPVLGNFVRKETTSPEEHFPSRFGGT